ncbi:MULTISPECIES: cytochrome P450 [Amycolatopsis]|uniref:Cytochrome P450 n=1 Tax=Amycolatopsis albidoflavus TaxID=102226 RepID=A0ABW5I885_9PSEU
MKTPGPTGTPLLGCLREYRGDLLAFITRCAREHGDFVPVRVVFHRGFLISDPALIGEVLTSRHEDFRKVFMLRNNKLFLGDGLLTSERESWREKRRLAQPAFHSDRMPAYATVMVDEAQRIADNWRSGGVRDVQQEMMKLTLRAVVRCLFDDEAEVDVAAIARHIEVVQRRMHERTRAIIPLPDSVLTPRNMALRRAISELDRIVNGFILASRAASGHRRGLLPQLMNATEDGRRLSDAELRDEAMTMFFAGHETTALALSWSWYLLAQHPAEAEIVHRELDDVLGGRPPTLDDLARLPATERAVKEAMRLYPPIFAFGRDAVRDTNVGGHPVPAGSSAMIAPWVIHRDPRLYPDPASFRPARWTHEFERQLPRFAYIPFGAGSRMCIGKVFAMTEAVLVLATLAQQYQPSLVPGHPVELWPTFSLRSKHGIAMTIDRRTAAVARPVARGGTP